MSVTFSVEAVMSRLTPAIQEKVFHRLGEQILGTLVLNTPVGNPAAWKSVPPVNYRPGHARFSWQTTLDQPASVEIPGFDPGGASTIARGVGVVRTAKLTQTINFTNLAPYIERLNEGWSIQQPPGFVDRSIRGGIASVTNARITV